MKAIEQYFHVVLFIMLYKVILTFKFVDETLVCDHANKSYWAVLRRSRLEQWGWSKRILPSLGLLAPSQAFHSVQQMKTVLEHLQPGYKKIIIVH